MQSSLGFFVEVRVGGQNYPLIYCTCGWWYRRCSGHFSEWYSLDGWTTVDERFDSEVIHSNDRVSSLSMPKSLFRASLPLAMWMTGDTSVGCKFLSILFEDVP